MGLSYYVVIVHAAGRPPELLSDRREMPLTFDTREETQKAIMRYWRENKGSNALKLTAVELED